MLNRVSNFIKTIYSTPTAPRKRSYAGANVGRLLSDWITMSTSADAEIRASLAKLRDRSRQLSRDNDFVKGAVRTVVNNVVGPKGIRLQAQVKRRAGRGAGQLDTKINSAIEDLWKDWGKAENCHTGGTLSFWEIERLIAGSGPTDGEILIRMIPRAFGSSPVALALEVIEPDLLDETYNDVLANGNEVRMGVERNEWKRPVAYHMKEGHPGDVSFAPGVAGSQRRRRIPADEVLHIYFKERPSQSRGVPWVASTISRLHQMAGLEEAEIVGQRAAASIMGFIRSPEGELQGDDVVDGDRVTDFEPGIWKYLAPGEEPVVPNITRNGANVDQFMRILHRGAAIGFGMSYSSFTGDYSQSNYSSSRLALGPERDNWRTLQNWIMQDFHQKVFNKWLDMAVLSGALNLPGYELNPLPYRRVKWLPRGWDWIDPQKEVGAYKDAVRSGFKTQTDVLSVAGEDLEEFYERRQREIELAEEMGLVFDTDPSKLSTAGQSQQTGQQGQQSGTKPAEGEEKDENDEELEDE